jgi:hypothetical protein
MRYMVLSHCGLRKPSGFDVEAWSGGTHVFDQADQARGILTTAPRGIPVLKSCSKIWSRCLLIHQLMTHSPFQTLLPVVVFLFLRLR